MSWRIEGERGPTSAIPPWRRPQEGVALFRRKGILLTVPCVEAYGRSGGLPPVGKRNASPSLHEPVSPGEIPAMISTRVLDLDREAEKPGRGVCGSPGQGDGQDGFASVQPCYAEQSIQDLDARGIPESPSDFGWLQRAPSRQATVIH